MNPDEPKYKIELHNMYADRWAIFYIERGQYVGVKNSEYLWINQYDEKFWTHCIRSRNELEKHIPRILSMHMPPKEIVQLTNTGVPIVPEAIVALLSDQSRKLTEQLEGRENKDKVDNLFIEMK